MWIMSVIRFEELEVWQEAISSNIIEGKERETIPEFVRYLYVAKGSSGELKTQLMIA